MSTLFAAAERAALGGAAPSLAEGWRTEIYGPNRVKITGAVWPLIFFQISGYFERMFFVADLSSYHVEIRPEGGLAFGKSCTFLEDSRGGFAPSDAQEGCVESRQICVKAREFGRIINVTFAKEIGRIFSKIAKIFDFLKLCRVPNI